MKPDDEWLRLRPAVEEEIKRLVGYRETVQKVRWYLKEQEAAGMDTVSIESVREVLGGQR